MAEEQSERVRIASPRPLTARRIFLYSIPVWGTAILTFFGLQLLSPRMSAVFGNIDEGAEGLRVLRRGRDVRPVKGDPLYQGDELVAGDAGSLVVTCLDGTRVEFAAGSVVQFGKQNGKRLSLVSGSFSAAVPPRRVEDPFIVHTETALITVHGEAFSVAIEVDTSVVDVTDGTASVVGASSDKSVKATSGQVVRVPANGIPMIGGD